VAETIISQTLLNFQPNSKLLEYIVRDYLFIAQRK